LDGIETGRERDEERGVFRRGGEHEGADAGEGRGKLGGAAPIVILWRP
jgi:hypothetical protein